MQIRIRKTQQLKFGLSLIGGKSYIARNNNGIVTALIAENLWAGVSSGNYDIIEAE